MGLAQSSTALQSATSPSALLRPLSPITLLSSPLARPSRLNMKASTYPPYPHARFSDRLATHPVGRYYNFSSTASGKYKFTPLHTFTAVEADGSLAKITATTDGASTHLSGNLVTSVGLSPKSIGGGFDARFAPGGLERRIGYSGCSSTQQSQTSAAVSAGQSLASRSATHIANNPSGSTLQTTWFGTFSSTRASALQTAFTRLTTYPSGWTYNCNTCASETSTYAYVYPSSYGTVYLCGYFWIAPATGSGSRAE